MGLFALLLGQPEISVPVVPRHVRRDLLNSVHRPPLVVQSPMAVSFPSSSVLY